MVGKRKLVAKTCVICGILKMASEYHKSIKGYTTSYCNRCWHRLGKKYEKAANARSQDTATNSGNYWTQANLDELERLIFDEKLSHKEIGIRLGRSISAVTAARHKWIGTPPKELDEASKG